MIGKFLKAWFASQSAITALIGSSPVRLFPGTVPQAYRETFPRMIYTQIGGEDITQELDGPGEVWTAEVQLTMTDRGRGGYETLQTLKAAIVGTSASRKLHHYSGTLADVEIVKAKCENEIDNTTPPDDASDDTIQEMVLDFRFWYVRG